MHKFAAVLLSFAIGNQLMINTIDWWSIQSADDQYDSLRRIQHIFFQKNCKLFSVFFGLFWRRFEVQNRNVNMNLFFPLVHISRDNKSSQLFVNTSLLRGFVGEWSSCCTHRGLEKGNRRTLLFPISIWGLDPELGETAVVFPVLLTISSSTSKRGLNFDLEVKVSSNIPLNGSPDSPFRQTERTFPIL